MKALLPGRVDGDHVGYRHRKLKPYPSLEWVDIYHPEPGQILHEADLHVDGSFLPVHMLLPRYLSGNDYRGGSLTRANFETFQRQWGTVPGVFEVEGGYHGYGIALVYPKFYPNDLIDALVGLKDYPVLNEEDWSRVESEREEEAWNGGYNADFRSLLISQGIFDGVDEDVAHDDGCLWTTFETLREAANEGWHHGTGDTQWIDLGSILKNSKQDRQGIRHLLGLT